MEYKDTLNLPRTDFAMKADLVTREPERLKKWQEADLYAKIQAARAAAGEVRAARWAAVRQWRCSHRHRAQ